MRVHPLICLTVCGLAAVLWVAAGQATASAEAVVSPLPARRPAGVPTLSEAAGRPRRDAPGVFVYTPSAPPSAYPAGPHASQGGRFAAAPTTPAAPGTAYAPLRAEPAAPWGWARPAEWAAQGGAAALLYGLTRGGRRRRRCRPRRRVRW